MATPLSSSFPSGCPSWLSLSSISIISIGIIIGHSVSQFTTKMQLWKMLGKTFLPLAEICPGTVFKADELPFGSPGGGVRFDWSFFIFWDLNHNILGFDSQWTHSIPCHYRQSTSWGTPPCPRLPSTCPPTAPTPSSSQCEGSFLATPSVEITV